MDGLRASVGRLSASFPSKLAPLHKDSTNMLDLNVADIISKLTTKVETQKAEIARLQGELATTKAHSTYRKRPSVLVGRTVETKVGCGPLYITLNEDDTGRPFEVFFKLGRSGSCQQSYLEALGVAMSVGLRHGADPQKFVEKFEGMRCPNPKLRDADGPSTLSCADGISKGLAKAIDLAFAPTLLDTPIATEAKVVSVAEPSFLPEVISTNGSAFTNGGNGKANTNGNGAKKIVPLFGAGMCPKCNGNLVFQSGCETCISQCGYVGKCG